MKRRFFLYGALAAALCTASLALSDCGVITAPVTVAEAVASNANFSFTGDVVDQNGHQLSSVIIQRRNSHRFWTPVQGGRDVYDTRTVRADGTFDFQDRGQLLEFTFTKDGYSDATFQLSADNPHVVSTPLGTWPLDRRFTAVMLTTAPRDAALVHFNEAISYQSYPIATAIALPNLATDGRSGDIQYQGKDARDFTIFPPGTLYLTMDNEPPTARDARGDVDPADLDVPNRITLHLPGANSGLIRIEPRVGFHPIATSDTAPRSGYEHELSFDRKRLRAMRSSAPKNIIDAHEYFFFRAGERYGKGMLSWANFSGKPSFRYELYMQPQAQNRDLTTHHLEN